MRLGKLLTQTMAILIAITLSVLGYVWYRQHEISQFRTGILEKFEFSNLTSMLTVLGTAPDVTCREDHSDFNSSTRVAFYHAGSKSRFDLTDMTSGNTQHWVMDEKNLYIWNEKSSQIISITADSSSLFQNMGEALPALFVHPSCAVWWLPDEGVFELPVSKSIVPYDELQ